MSAVLKPDAAGRRYVPAPLHVDVEQEDARDVVEALCASAEGWCDVHREPDGRVEIEANLCNVTAAAALYRTALAIEDARLTAGARQGNGRRRGGS